MALTPLSASVNIHQTLPDEPNDVGGMTAAQLKAAWDTPANTLKEYLNGTLIPELDAAHLPYIYGSAGTVQDAVDGFVAGIVPDDSVTTAMLKADSVTGEKIASSAYALFAPWKLLQEYKTAGTYTYTVPAGVTELGVWMVGGGGSGAAVTPYGSEVYYSSGGASGYAKHMAADVTPGQGIPIVVGAGGAAVTATYSGGRTKNGAAGGATSFNGVTASGGGGGAYHVGGDYMDCPDGGQGACRSSTIPYGCRVLNTVSSYDGESQSPMEAMNPFAAVQPYWLVAGGHYAATSTTTLPNGNTASSGIVGSTGAVISGVASTEPGAGGGAARVGGTANSGESATSAAGAPGAVLIYARSVP